MTARSLFAISACLLASSAAGQAPPYCSQLAPDGTLVELQVDEPLPGAVITAPPCETVDVAGVASTIGIPPQIDVYFALDRSGSTGSCSGTDVNQNGILCDAGDSILAAEVEAARRLVADVSPSNVRIAIVTFDTFATAAVPLTSDFVLVNNALDSIQAGGSSGGTNFVAALNAVRSEYLLRGSATRLSLVLFLSDGEDNTSGPGAIQVAAQQLASLGLRADTFGVGPGADPTALTQIANLTGGVYRPLLNPGDILVVLPEVIAVGIDAVEVLNVATGVSIVVAPAFDGRFRVALPIVSGLNPIQVTATADDPDATTTTCDTDLELVSCSTNQPPACAIGGQLAAECGAGQGALAPDGSASSDPEGEALTYAWSAAGCPGAAFDDPGAVAPLLTLPGPPPCPATCEVRLVVRDPDGLEATCTAVVTVADTTPPDVAPGSVAACYPGAAEASAAALAATQALDACSGTALTAAVSGTCAATVEVTAEDACGNVASIGYTTRIDADPPALALPAPDTIECSEPGGVSAGDPRVAGWLAGASASDACGPAAVASAPPGFFPAGCAPGAATPVAFTATDDCGNQAAGTSSLRVADTTPPALAVPAPLALECTAHGGVPASAPAIQQWLASASAADACFAASVASAPPAFFPSACAPGAATAVPFTATDACGNAAAAASAVSVADTLPPVVAGCALRAAAPPGPASSGAGAWLAPRAPRAAASACSGASSALVEIVCGAAADACDAAPSLEPALVVTRHEVTPAGECRVVTESVPVACGELAWLVRLAAPCPARPPASPRPAVSVRSDGVRVIAGEALRLEVRSRDACDNLSAPCAVEAAGAGAPLPCAPAPARCPVSACGAP